MENTEEIINWALRDGPKLNLQATYYRGLDEYFNNIFDIKVTFSFNSQTFAGRGTDLDEDVAFCKALSEAVEHLACDYYNIPTTSGLSAHVQIELAKTHARNELIEHDAFLAHFLLGLQISKIDPGVKNLFIQDKIKIEVFHLCHSPVGEGVMVLANGLEADNPFGYIIGTSFKQNMQDAIPHAHIEVARTICHILSSKNIDDLTIEKFCNLQNYHFLNHGQLARNIDYASKLEAIFTKPIVKTLELCDLNSFTYEELSLNFLPTAPPVKLVRASNEKLQT